jgi:hypothetical protein
MRKKNDQSRKMFSLQPHHSEHTHSCLVSKARQGWAWLVLAWERDLQRRLLRGKQFRDKKKFK